MPRSVIPPSSESVSPSTSNKNNRRRLDNSKFARPVQTASRNRGNSRHRDEPLGHLTDLGKDHAYNCFSVVSSSGHMVKITTGQEVDKVRGWSKEKYIRKVDEQERRIVRMQSLLQDMNATLTELSDNRQEHRYNAEWEVWQELNETLWSGQFGNRTYKIVALFKSSQGFMGFSSSMLSLNWVSPFQCSTLKFCHFELHCLFFQIAMLRHFWQQRLHTMCDLGHSEQLKIQKLLKYGAHT